MNSLAEGINGFIALHNLISAYDYLSKDATDKDDLFAAATQIAKVLVDENEALHAVRKSGAGALEPIGSCRIFMDSVLTTRQFFIENCPEMIQDNSIMLPVFVDSASCVRMVISSRDDDSTASRLIQYLLFNKISNNLATKLYCVDLASGGNFFNLFFKFVSDFQEKTGGRVYTKPQELDTVIERLEAFSASAMKSLNDSCPDVYSACAQDGKKPSESVLAIRVKSLSQLHDRLNRINVLMMNGCKTGINVMIVCDEAVDREILNNTDVCLYSKAGQLFIDKSYEIPLALSPTVNISSSKLNEMGDEIRKASTIDTRIDSHPELMDKLFSMNSKGGIRIPFAFDQNGILQYFEIGGSFPSHALISGTTGSGKSVLLHTLILQTIRNYHPDDVEIWAIDYKAVEFDCYMENSAPHFRFIGHDTSSEFSLSLVEKIYAEYEKRAALFLSSGVKNIGEYRSKNGPRSMPRILVIIDEFQLLTQAVQKYTGNKDYRIELENLFRLTRAMGISFILCSQTIASGLSGLTDAARDQIGCRLCLKNIDENEIRETLMISSSESRDLIRQAKELLTGQGIYKRAKGKGEDFSDGSVYDYKKINVLFHSERDREKLLSAVKTAVSDDYTPKDVILVRGDKREPISSKVRHPINLFMSNGQTPDDDDNVIHLLPAAPVSLDDYYCIPLGDEAGANLLIVGEDDSLRDSLLFHTVCGLLTQKNNVVCASFINESFPDRARMIQILEQIRSDRFTINVGMRQTLDTIRSLKRIRPSYDHNYVYIWYGLDKLRNELYLLEQDDEEDQREETGKIDEPAGESVEDLLKDYMAFLTPKISQAQESSRASSSGSTDAPLDFETCKKILSGLFDIGPENNYHSIVIFNNKKTMSKSGLIQSNDFDNIIGTKMSVDDSYELFGSSLAISKANDNTVVFYPGGGAVIPLHPYLLPDKSWIEKFNRALEQAE